MLFDFIEPLVQNVPGTSSANDEVKQRAFSEITHADTKLD